MLLVINPAAPWISMISTEGGLKECPEGQGSKLNRCGSAKYPRKLSAPVRVNHKQWTHNWRDH